MGSGSPTPLQPEGIELIAAAVHEWEAAREELAQAEISLREARSKVDQAAAKVRQLAVHAQCTDECPDRGKGGARESKYDSIIVDQEVPIVWRLGFMLLRDPVLDYQAAAATIWDDNPDKKTAKNRVNVHVQRLKSMGVVSSLGSNRFEIDPTLLAEKSGVPIPGGDSQ